MRLQLQTVSYNSKYASVFSVTKLSCLASLLLIICAGSLAAENSEFPICHKLWTVLGQDLAAWRERCLDGAQQSNSQCCKAEKEYFENRRPAHRQMCFYQGE
jgi:hypothetical protein